MPVKSGFSATVELVVTGEGTAAALGRGAVEALATPRVVGLCEQAAQVAVADRLGPT